MNKDPYSTLGVDKNATDKEIKQLYFKSGWYNNNKRV
jgi:curved DNA-binding protein CbpA